MFMQKSHRSRLAAACLALSICCGGSLMPVAAWADSKPGEAESHSTVQPRFDSLSDLCAGLNKSGRNYRDCIMERARAHRPSPGEIKCYIGAGLAMGGLLTDNYISKGEARFLAARLIGVGAFGCVSAWLT